MTTAAFVLVLALVALLVASVALPAACERKSSSLASLTKRRAIVTLKTGEAFAGVLYAADRESLCLRSAELVAAGEKRGNLPVDGEVLILRADVAYLQFP